MIFRFSEIDFLSSPTWNSRFQFVALFAFVLMTMLKVSSLCVQQPERLSSETHNLGSVQLGLIFTQADSIRAEPVVSQWASQDFLSKSFLLGHSTQQVLAVPNRDSFTAPEHQRLATEADSPVRIPNRGLLQPISISDSEKEVLIHDSQVAPASFQEPAIETEKPKPTIKLVTEPPQVDQPPLDKPNQTDSEASLIPDELSLDKLALQIKEQIELISKETGDETLKEEQLKQLNTANSWIQKANNSQSYINVQVGLQETFETRLRSLQDGLKTPLPSETPDPKTSSENLQMELQDKRQALQQQKTQMGENQRKMEDRGKRIERLPADRTAAQEKLSKSKAAIAGLGEQPDGYSKQLSTLILKAQEWAAKKEIEALNIEAPRLEESGKLLPLERSTLSRKIEKLDSDIEIWNTAYNEKRRLEIVDQTQEAEKLRQKAVNNDPRLSTWAKLNQDLAVERESWTEGIKNAQTNSKTVTAQLEGIVSSLNALRQSTENDVSTEVGISLVKQRHSLIMPWESQARIQTLRAKLKDIRLKAFRWQQDRQKLPSVETVVSKLLASKKLELGLDRKQQELEYVQSGDAKRLLQLELKKLEAELSEFETLAGDLVESRIKLLDDLNEDSEVYQTELTNEKNQRLSLIKEITEMRGFIDEKALWIQSANAIWESPMGQPNSDLVRSFQGVPELCKPSNWQGFLATLHDRLDRRPSEFALAGLVLIGLFVVSHRLRENS